MNDHLSALRRLIADDGVAMTFQTLAQYRSMLLRAISDIQHPEQGDSNASN